MTVNHSNITITIRNRFGEEETYDNCRSIQESENGEILEIQYKLFPNRDELHTEEYDAKEWRIVDVNHTEDPI